MHGGVGRGNVRTDCRGACDVDSVGAEGKLASIHRCLGPGRAEVFGAEALSGDHVVGEDAGEEVLVGEDGAEGVGIDCGEGIVGGCEDGEWSFAVEGVDEVGFDDCADQGGEHGVVGSSGACGIVGHSSEAAFTVGGNCGTARAECAEHDVLHRLIGHGFVFHGGIGDNLGSGCWCGCFDLVGSACGEHERSGEEEACCSSESWFAVG